MQTQYSKWTAAIACALVVLGIARASNSHYAERRRAFFESQEAERKRLGLTDWAQVRAKYPCPEITLCQAARVAPGATGNLAVRGKFISGSKFLLENDDVEVVKENATTTEYHATVRVPSEMGPGYSPLHVFSAISGYEARCPAVYFGGKYEWDFTAQNGWRIKLHSAGDVFPKDGADPVVKYTAEFYRGSESKPFETREFGLDLSGTLYGNSYSGGLTQSASAQGGPEADMQKLMQKLYDPSTSPQERSELAKHLMDMQQQMLKQTQTIQQQQQKEAEFACRTMTFSGNADPVEGQVICGPNGTIKFKGTRHFVGP